MATGDTGVTDAEYALHRFRRQIAATANYVASKYRYTIEKKDARQEAARMVIGYANSGVLGELEAKVAGDPRFRIEQLLIQELRQDLLTWARKAFRAASPEILMAFEETDEGALRTRLQPDGDPYDEVEFRMCFPLYCMRAFDRLTIGEIAAVLGISDSTVDRRLAGEKVQAVEFFGERRRGRVRRSEGVLPPRDVISGIPTEVHIEGLKEAA